MCISLPRTSGARNVVAHTVEPMKDPEGYSGYTAPSEVIETAHFYSYKKYILSCFWDSVLLWSIFIPGSGRFPGNGNGNPLQYSCLENSMDGGAWQATVHGVTKSRKQLSD